MNKRVGFGNTTEQSLRLLVVQGADASSDLVDTLLARDELCLRTGTVKEGYELLWRRNPQVVLIDSSVPFDDVLAFCRRVHTFFVVPILVLHSSVYDAERVMLLDNGADDVVDAACPQAELVARCQALVRRLQRQIRHFPRAAYLHYDSMQLDVQLHQLRLPEGDVQLPWLLPVKLLAVLFAAQGTVVSRAAIARELFNSTEPNALGHVKGLIWTIRDTVEREGGFAPVFDTVSGLGYRLLDQDRRAELISSSSYTEQDRRKLRQQCNRLAKE
jgi:DNA-binding response OmpR family regulator